MSLIKLGMGLIKSRFQSLPFSANFKVTERCNLRCPFCSIWRHGNKSKELSLEQIRSLARELKKVGLTRIVLTGGEPLIRKDIVDIVHAFYTQKISTTLLTNGLLSRDMLIRELFDAGLDHMGISMDFLTPEKQDALYNTSGSWKKIEKTLQSALKWNKRGFVYIMTTLIPENIHEIVPLFWLMEGRGAHFVLNPVMGSKHKEENRVFSGLSSAPGFNEEQKAGISMLYDELIRLKRKGHKILSSEQYLKDSLETIITDNVSWHCHAGLYYFTIYSDGGVAPCNEMPALFSVLDGPLHKNFFSPQFQEKAAEMRQSCSGCNFSCWRELSLLLTNNKTFSRQIVSTIKQKLI